MLVAGLFLLIAGAVSAEETVRLTNGEWPPFTSERLKHYGVYSHIVSEAFAMEGIKVEYTFFPWPRGYSNVVKGLWDGSITWAPTREKMQDVLFSDPVVMHTKVIFHLKRFAFDWRTVDDLKGLKIGATATYTYGDEFDQASRDGRISVEYTTTDIQNLKKLFARRIQIFPSDIDVAYDLLKANFSSEDVSRLTHHAKPIQKTHTCVIFTKKNPEKGRRLLETFNRGLGKLKKRGIYDRLLEASKRGEYLPKKRGRKGGAH